MAFMVREVFHGKYYEVETNAGTEIVPACMVNFENELLGYELADYLEGDTFKKSEVYKPKKGWLARLTAPGYLDCTAWGAYETEEQALEALDELYGTDEEE